MAQWLEDPTLKRWRTTFRRGVLPGSAHRRQAADWSVETRQSTDVRDLDQPSFFALHREMHEFRKFGLEYRQKSLQWIQTKNLDRSRVTKGIDTPFG